MLLCSSGVANGLEAGTTQNITSHLKTIHFGPLFG